VNRDAQQTPFAPIASAALRYSCCSVERGAHRAIGARELRQRGITDEFYDTAAVGALDDLMRETLEQIDHLDGRMLVDSM
jgi:hypothetical protein